MFMAIQEDSKGIIIRSDIWFSWIYKDGKERVLDISQIYDKIKSN